MMSKKLREKAEEMNPGKITAPRRSIPGSAEHEQEIAAMFNKHKPIDNIDGSLQGTNNLISQISQKPLENT